MYEKTYRRRTGFLVWAIIFTSFTAFNVLGYFVMRTEDAKSASIYAVLLICTLLLSVLFWLLYLFKKVEIQPRAPRYKRQQWHSGYAYIVHCPACGTSMTYRDTNLRYSAWHPDGYVLCPACNAVVAHSEFFAVDENGQHVYSSIEDARRALKDGYMRSLR